MATRQRFWGVENEQGQVELIFREEWVDPSPTSHGSYATLRFDRRALKWRSDIRLTRYLEGGDPGLIGLTPEAADAHLHSWGA